MTHYQKLATMIFRVLGLLFIIAGVLAALISIGSLIIVYQFSFIIYMIYVNLYWLPLMTLGMFLFILSRKLAKWICFDFDKFDEQK
jgi:hypothetical protein